jgi:hypothetical protein
MTHACAQRETTRETPTETEHQLRTTTRTVHTSTHSATTPREDTIQPHVSITIYYATPEYKPHTHCSHHTFPSVFPTDITVTPVISQRK